MDNFMKDLVMNQKLKALEDSFKAAPDSELFTEYVEVDASGCYDNLNDFISELETTVAELAKKHNVKVKGV